MKSCPFRNSPNQFCLEERCALFDEKKQKCCLVLIADGLACISLAR
jgi:hypothetical protein